MPHTHVPSCDGPWPVLPYESWKETLKTLHMWTQIVGKIRLASMPFQNHSWHASLYVTANGFSTGSMPYNNGIYEIEFDFSRHQLIIRSSFHREATIELRPRTVADFYAEVMKTLEDLKIKINIYGRPNEVAESIPFAKNTTDKSYDAQAVTNFWQASVSIHNVMLQFRSGFIGKCSPVHFFWGAFDMAVTRFSGRTAPLHQGEMPNMPARVMQEAYSQELSSCGFWPGNDMFPRAAFYAYSYPGQEAFKAQNILPKQAYWSPELGEFLLSYDDVRNAEDPKQTLMNFFETTYRAAARTANWHRSNLERGHITM